MVLDTTDDDGRTIEVVASAAEVSVKLVAERFVLQKRSPLFGGEHNVEIDLCK